MSDERFGDASPSNWKPLSLDPLDGPAPAKRNRPLKPGQNPYADPDTPSTSTPERAAPKSGHAAATPRRQDPRHAFAAQVIDRSALDAPAPELGKDLMSQVAQIGQKARQEAEKKGYDEGFRKGHAEGRKTGHTEGLKTGQDEGYQSGHREGYEKGLQEGRKLSSEEAARLGTLADDFAASVATLDKQISEALVALSLDIARQVIRSTLDVNPEKIVDIVRDILQTESGDQAGLRIRLHPDDVPLVQRYLPEETGRHPWHLQPDEHIERGGCIAETPLGSIDATLRTRWERVAGNLQPDSRWNEADQ